VVWIDGANELALVLALAAVRFATTGLGDSLCLASVVCPQNLHLMSLLDMVTLELAGLLLLLLLLLGLLVLIELMGDMFVAVSLVKSARDLMIGSILWIEMIGVGV
jgi:hypothetical protein